MRGSSTLPHWGTTESTFESETKLVSYFAPTVICAVRIPSWRRGSPRCGRRQGEIAEYLAQRRRAGAPARRRPCRCLGGAVPRRGRPPDRAGTRPGCGSGGRLGPSGGELGPRYRRADRPGGVNRDTAAVIQVDYYPSPGARFRTKGTRAQAGRSEQLRNLGTGTRSGLEWRPALRAARLYRDGQ